MNFQEILTNARNEFKLAKIEYMITGEANSFLKRVADLTGLSVEELLCEK